MESINSRNSYSVWNKIEDNPPEYSRKIRINGVRVEPGKHRSAIGQHAKDRNCNFPGFRDGASDKSWSVDERGRISQRTDAEGYSAAIGKMLFTQGRSELQRLCPYLHVVSLLRDQIPDRAWNPDNSSFDPSPVGSSPGPASPVCARERVKTHQRRKKKK